MHKLIATVLQVNGNNLTDWCEQRGFKPSQLYYYRHRDMPKYAKLRKDLAAEVRRAKPAILRELEKLEVEQ